jgi:hypothetical protein
MVVVFDSFQVAANTRDGRVAWRILAGAPVPVPQTDQRPPQQAGAPGAVGTRFENTDRVLKVTLWSGSGSAVPAVSCR